MESSTDLLQDIYQETTLVQASSGKRFLNLLIDSIIWQLVSSALTYVLTVINFTLFDYTGSTALVILNLLISLSAYVLFMAALESATRGRTIGKLITGTKAVNDWDGSDISFITALKRSLSRLVPFEVFSALGTPSYPWHDKWARTYVIDIKQSTVIKTPDYLAEKNSTIN